MNSKSREYQRNYYLKNLDRLREKHRAQQEIQRMRMWRPDGHAPRSLNRKVRLKCLAMGGDPSSRNDMQLAIHELWHEAEEFSIEWQWLHPEESYMYAKSLCDSWLRMMSDKSKASLLKEAGRLA